MRVPISDNECQYIEVTLWIGDDYDEEAYSLRLERFIEPLTLDGDWKGTDDISLLKEAVVNEIDLKSMPKEKVIHAIFKEDGELEDVFWHKYYVLERIWIEQ